MKTAATPSQPLPFNSPAECRTSADGFLLGYIQRWHMLQWKRDIENLYPTRRSLLPPKGPQDMPGSRTAYINFGRALPKDEPLTGLMGRMFVILADLLIERDELNRKIGTGKLGEDEEQYRYLYFMRATSLTLHDGRLLLGAFESVKRFRGWLHADPLLHEEWKKAKKAVDQAGKTLDFVRNKIGAHVDKSIEEGMRSIDGATEGKLEMGSDGWLRPHLAQIILLATLAPRESTEEWLKEVQEIGATMAGAIAPMRSALQIAFMLYRKQYPAIWG